jgi:ABC-type transport system involved in multi-copper enzyme maturation permease subunit
MKKYIAVIQDSFREAFSSRILWLLLILITMMLLAVAPLGYREEVTWQLGDSDVREWPKLMEKVRDEGPLEQPSPSRRIWLLLDDELKEKLTELKIPGEDQEPVNPWEFIATLSGFQKALNKLLEQPDFYDEESWENVQMVSMELRELHDEDPEKLTDQERSRYHRLLVEAAFPELVRSSPPTSIQLVYAWRDIGPQQPLRGTTLKDTIQSSAAWALKWFVGAAGVAIAILVTAPIIPQMFDPGSLHLLLSKPVARWLLFLSKFVGGCAFILIGATYLIGGIWLILGLRFAIWDAKLLLSIPIYLFMFAIYYSVSAFAGVIWRSPVISIGISVIFFGACWVIGTSKIGFERMIWNKERITKIVPAGESLIAVDETGMSKEWNVEDHKWKEVFVTDSQKQSRAFMMFMPAIPGQFKPVGPIYDAAEDRLLSAQPSFPPNKLEVCVGPRGDKWKGTTGVPAPTGTLALMVDPDGEIMAISSLDIYRMEGNPLQTAEPIKVFGMEIPLGGGPFYSVGPDPPTVLNQPAAASMDPVTGDLVLYTRGNLLLLTRDEQGRYERKVEKTLDGEERQPVVLGVGPTALVLGRQDGRVQILDVQTAEKRHEFQPEGRNAPRFVATSPDGRWFAIVFHNGYLWAYDAETHALERAKVSGQGDISAASFTADGQLLVADQNVRVRQYQMEPWKAERTYSPRLGFLATSYRYGLVPLYTVFPKPGELDKTFEYLLSGKETKTEDADDLTAAQETVDPWTPLWSSAAFTLVVLMVACVYIECQEF